MAQPAINVNSREFWTNYVTTAQYEAGKALGREPDAAVLQAAQNNNVIHAQYRPIIINYNPWNFDWSSRVVNNYSPAPSREERQEQREEENAQWARVAGTIITVVASFLAFYTYKKYTTQQETLAYTQQVHAAIPHWNNHLDPLLADIYQLVTQQLQIDELNTAKINKYAIAALTLLAGGIMMAIGGFATISALITIGKITTVAALAIGAGAMGWHWSDSETLTGHYSHIAGRGIRISLAEKILRNLPHRYDAEMHRIDQQNPPAYQSLFPNYINLDPNVYAGYQYAQANAPADNAAAV